MPAKKASSDSNQISAMAELIRSSVRASVGAGVPLAVILAHLDELAAAEQASVLEACREELQSALDDLTGFPAHEDHAGLALDLLRGHYELDLETVNSLLAAQAKGGTQSKRRRRG